MITYVCTHLDTPYTGNISGGKFWRTIQVKAVGEQKFGEKATVSTYANTFSVYL